MYPYQTPLGTVQPPGPGYPYVQTPGPAPIHHYPPPSAPAKNIQTRLKLSQATLTIVPSVLACILVQAVAEFFLITTALTFQGAVQNAREFSDDPSHDGNVLYIVFSVFSALASAMCAPMIQNSGYSLIIMSGTVLMLFCTLSSSLVTSAEVLVIPYSVFGACAYGLLRTGPQVAMLDFLNDRRGLATGLSYLGVTIGQLAGAMSFGFTDMKDDANYDGSGNARWPNNMRVIEVTAVLALMASAMIRKPSFTTGSWPELFHYVPFYILCLLNFCVSLGFDMLSLVYSKVPGERDFETHPSGSHAILTVSFISQLVEFAAVVLILVINGAFGRAGGFRRAALLAAGIGVAILAAGSYINKLIYDDFWDFALYASVAGFVKALVLVSLPLAMITYTGRLNYKIGLPFLELSGGLGALLSYIIKDDLEMPDDEPIETGWYIAAAMFTLFAISAVMSHRRYVPWDVYVAETQGDQSAAQRVNVIENAAFAPEDGLDGPGVAGILEDP